MFAGFLWVSLKGWVGWPVTGIFAGAYEQAQACYTKIAAGQGGRDQLSCIK